MLYVCSLRLHLLFHVVDECLIAELCTARCGILAREIPVALVVGDGFVQSVYRLIDELYGCLQLLRTQHFHNLLVYLVNAERLVDVAYAVAHHLLRLKKFQLA